MRRAGARRRRGPRGPRTGVRPGVPPSPPTSLLRILVAAAAIAAPVASPLGALPAAAAPVDTTARTIQDVDGDNLLEMAPGEDHTVLGAPEDFRPPRDGSILNFVQLSDFQAVDEESPGRVEFLDTTQRGPFAPFSAAYRPHEALSLQVVEAMVRQIRNTRSPVTGRPPRLAILTGDNADSQQYDEVRWFIDVLDGGTHVDPDSGVGPACDSTPGNPYDGVRGGGRTGYYEPDASAGEDGDGYSPNRAENVAETGRDVTVRDFPGLLERAQSRFRAVGLGMPWYTAFGNHDALVQGNSPDAYLGPLGASGEQSNPNFQALATGCEKPVSAANGTGGLLEPPAGAARATVPPDPRRCYLAKDEPAGGGAPAPCSSGGFVQQHFLTTGTPVGHGFAERPPEARAAHDGYYAFSPRPGLRFAVLDTITDECGSEFCSEGSVDDAQFRWLEREVAAAAARGEYVLVFSHHTLRTTRFPSTDPSEQPVHYGERLPHEDPQQPRNPAGAESLEELYCRSPNVIAHVAGHEHESYVRHHDCEADLPPVPGAGDFFMVSTAAHLDYPQQARLIELVDNGDGTMSLVLTMVDHAGPANPGAPPPDDDPNGQAPDAVLRLASIARELAYNDPQGNRAARGGPEDRNVIARVERPWPPPVP